MTRHVLMHQENLLCGYEIVSPIGQGGSEIRHKFPYRIVFKGTYRQCKFWAKSRRLLMSQAPSVEGNR